MVPRCVPLLHHHRAKPGARNPRASKLPRGLEPKGTSYPISAKACKVERAVGLLRAGGHRFHGGLVVHDRRAEAGASHLATQAGRLEEVAVMDCVTFPWRPRPRSPPGERGDFQPAAQPPGRWVGKTARASPGTPPPASARLLGLPGLSFNQPPYRQASARALRPPRGRPSRWAGEGLHPTAAISPGRDPTEGPTRSPGPPPAPTAARGRPTRATSASGPGCRPGPGPGSQGRCSGGREPEVAACPASEAFSLPPRVRDLGPLGRWMSPHKG